MLPPWSEKELTDQLVHVLAIQGPNMDAISSWLQHFEITQEEWDGGRIEYILSKIAIKVGPLAYLLKIEYLNRFNREGLNGEQLQRMQSNRFCIETIRKREQSNADIIQRAIDDAAYDAQESKHIQHSTTKQKVYQNDFSPYLGIEDDELLSDVPPDFTLEYVETENITEEEQEEVLMTSHD